MRVTHKPSIQEFMIIELDGANSAGNYDEVKGLKNTLLAAYDKLDLDGNTKLFIHKLIDEITFRQSL